MQGAMESPPSLVLYIRLSASTVRISPLSCELKPSACSSKLNSLQNRSAVDNFGERKLYNNAVQVLNASQHLEP